MGSCVALRRSVALCPRNSPFIQASTSPSVGLETVEIVEGVPGMEADEAGGG